MKVINQNILDVTEGIIVHQVNTAGVMGAGVAVAIADKYPSVFTRYKELCETNGRDELMGMVQPVKVGERLVVANLFGQHLGFPAGAGGRMTSYDATVDAWVKIAEYRNRIDPQPGGAPVYIPYLMGCGLGGGSWQVYSAIVDAMCPGVTACRI
jgi:O-acetyl-ADP-ribose deacetylase (regulator of RNase III)